MNSALDIVLRHGIRYTAAGEEYAFQAEEELAELRAYAARMKAERDAWSQEACRLGLELARARAMTGSTGR